MMRECRGSRGGDMFYTQHSRLMSYVTFLSAILWRDMKHVVCKKYKSEPKLCGKIVITESNNTEMYLEKCSGMFYMHQACVTVSGVWVQDLSRAYQLVSTHHPGDPFHPCLDNFCPPLPNHFPVFQILHMSPAYWLTHCCRLSTYW